MSGQVLFRRHDFVLRGVGVEDRAAFDAALAQSPQGDLLQCYGWGELKRRSGWIPLRCLIERRGAPVAAATILKRRIPGTPWSFFYLPRGPALDFGDRATLVFFRDALRHLARRHRAAFAKLDPDVADDAAEGADADAADPKVLLRRYGFTPVPPDDSVIGGTQPRAVWRLNLNGSLEGLHAGLAKDNKYFLRRAEREKIVVRQGEEADLAIFHQLFEGTGKRKGFIVRGLGYFEAMWRNLAPDGHLKLFIADYKGQPLAAVLVGRLGDRSWGMYQGTSDEHRNVGCSYYLIWRIIAWAHGEGCAFFDLGGVPWQRSAPMEHFKGSFGGYRRELIGEYDYVFRPAVYRLLLGALALRTRARRARRRVLRAGRGLLGAGRRLLVKRGCGPGPAPGPTPGPGQDAALPATNINPGRNDGREGKRTSEDRRHPVQRGKRGPDQPVGPGGPARRGRGRRRD